jgi:hypothetical protein
MTARFTIEEAWRAADETLCAYQPRLELPPADLETRETSPYLPPVRFFGEVCGRYDATRPLPASCQHSLASALDDLTRDLTPMSAATPSVAAVRSPSPAPDPGEVISRAGEGRALPCGVAR